MTSEQNGMFGMRGRGGVGAWGRGGVGEFPLGKFGQLWTGVCEGVRGRYIRDS